MAKSKSVSKKISPADAVDEQLGRYREMRDFGITEEPSGATGKKSKSTTVGLKKAHALPFVIQKHAASHLHYDFRLGWNGVLKSWAVAKGPSYFTGDRRLAVQVEDHPMEYGGFEGIIPKGQYGGGTVMVWDQGTWTPQPGHEDVDAGLRTGTLKFVMYGTKMKGKWTLVRMGGKAANERKPNWLLIKEHDDFERSKTDPCITEEAPNSVVTGRTLEQIAAHEDHVWNSKDTAQGEAWFRQNAKTAMPLKPLVAASERSVRALPKELQPAFLAPQLALEATEPPVGDGWLHELKLDGYRIQARKSKSKVQLLTRKGLDWTHRMISIAEAVAALPSESVTLDGEVVVLSENGTTSFADLQSSFQDGTKHALTYFAFDLLHLNGGNPRGLGLRDRKAFLAQILPPDGEALRLSEHIETSGDVMFKKACELHAEGILSKRASAPYAAGRGSSWLKSKCLHEQEFVIGGYTLSADGDDRIGSLLLGYYKDHDLIYAGRTGTGFTQKIRKSMFESLDAIRVSKPAFASISSDARRGAVFVKPKLVAQVRFATWTADNMVRQAAFLGLREDKSATDVLREEATVAPKPKANAARKTRVAQVVMNGAPAMRLTHPEKIIDSETKLTKKQLADYYWAVSERMLPYIAGRPLSLVRCPEGSGKPCFYQKHVNHMLPPGVEGVDVPDKKTGKIESYITLHTREALAGLAQMGVLEIHPWGSRNNDLEHPDQIIFDLDPDETLPWSALTEAADDVRSRLRKAGITSFLKTTGGKGLHIVAPIAPVMNWAELKEFAHRFVLGMERAQPARYLTKMSKAARKGKIFLDYLRNERGATAVAAYSPRARVGAPVSLPIPWKDLQLNRRPVFLVHDLQEWKSLLTSNPWRDFDKTRQSLIRSSLVA